MEVKAGRRWIPICYTLESHIVSLYETAPRNDFEADVFCAVCGESAVRELWRGKVSQRERERRGINASGGEGVYEEEYLPLAAYSRTAQRRCARVLQWSTELYLQASVMVIATKSSRGDG